MYYSVNDYCRAHFGKKLYKLAIDGGCTCPNRDGTLGTRGCIFCDGAGAFAERDDSVSVRLERAKARVAAKKPQGYIAYFQSFTNTYAPLEKLRAMYSEAMAVPGVEVLSIATRPDCLGGEVLQLLGECRKTMPVWVELGLQTVKEESVAYIRRAYPTDCYDEAVRALHEQGIYVITHIILGLPGETTDDMKKTVLHAVNAGTDGIKLQLLHVLEGTDLAADYRQGKFKTLQLEEYIGILRDLLPLLPPDVAVHRLTGDGDKRSLIAPLWSADKKRVLNALRTLTDAEAPPEKSLRQAGQHSGAHEPYVKASKSI